MGDALSYDYRAYKTVILVASGINPGVAMNVVGHLAMALGARLPSSTLGKSPIVDQTGVAHMGISRYPLVCLKGTATKVRKSIRLSRSNANLLVADYPEEMLSTGHDDELCSAIESQVEDDLNYYGVAVFGPSAEVNEIYGRFSLWRAETVTVS